MAIKIEILDNALQVSDTVSGDVLIDQPAKDTWYVKKDLDAGKVKVYSYPSGNNNNINEYTSESFEGFPIDDCVNSADVTFTVQTFRDFCHASMGKSSASGGGADLENRIVLNQSNAATVLSGTVDSTKPYFVDGVVVLDGLGVNFSLLGGLNLLGYGGGNSLIVCSENDYALFDGTVTGNGFFVNGVSFVVSGTNSKVHNLTAQTGTESYNLQTVGYFDCTSLGELNGFFQGLEDNVFKLGGTPELTLSGNWNGYRVITAQVSGLADANFSLYKAGTGLSFASRFEADMNVDLSASSNFLDFSSANFTQPSLLQLDGCIITRNGIANAEDANITPNIDNTDIASAWTRNQGMKNTFVGGRLKITSEVATVVSDNITFYDLNGIYGTSKLVHFDSPASGQIRHLGNNPREYRVVFNGLLESGANDVLELKLVKWDNSASQFVDIASTFRQVNSLIGARDVAGFNWEEEVELDRNDFIKFQIRNDDAANVTAEIDTTVIVEAR